MLDYQEPTFIKMGSPAYDAWIEVTVSRNPEYGVVESKLFHWRGGRRAKLTYRALRDLDIKISPAGSVLQLGDLRLRVLEAEWDTRAVVVALDNRFSKVLALVWPMKHWGRILRAKIILTFCVWGLGKCPEGVIVSWDSVHIVKTVQDWRRRWTEHVKRVMAH